MNKEEPTDLTLAIESAIAGGSVSLLSGDRELDFWIGTDRVSRAEELMPIIIGMLEGQKIDRRMLCRLAVSLGPGSFTGIRIGIATVLGLKNALHIPAIGISALEAIAASAERSGRVMAALPVGRDLVCSQIFDLGETRSAIAITEPMVNKTVADPGDHVAILAHEYISGLIDIQIPEREVTSVGADLARLIGRAAVFSNGTEALDPLFVQPA